MLNRTRFEQMFVLGFLFFWNRFLPHFPFTPIAIIFLFFVDSFLIGIIITILWAIKNCNLIPIDLEPEKNETPHLQLAKLQTSVPPSSIANWMDCAEFETVIKPQRLYHLCSIGQYDVRRDYIRFARIDYLLFSFNC